MHQKHPTPEEDHPDRRPAPAAAMTSPSASPAGQLQVRHVEQLGGWSRRGRVRLAWYRLRLTVQEMNYAPGRVAELQMRLP